MVRRIPFVRRRSRASCLRSREECCRRRECRTLSQCVNVPFGASSMMIAQLLVPCGTSNTVIAGGAFLPSQVNSLGSAARPPEFSR